MSNKTHECSTLIDMIETQVWQFTEAQTYGKVNQAHADFLGIDKAKLELKSVNEVLPSDLAKALTGDNSQIFTSGKKMQSKIWVTNHSGEKRLLDITKTPRFDKEGTVEYLVCMGSDITDFNKLEEDLHHSNAVLRKFLSASPIGIGIVEKRKISWLNDQMLKTFGYNSLGEVQWKSSKEFYADQTEYDKLGSQVYEKLRQGDPVEQDIMFKRKDGSEFAGHIKISSYDASNPVEKAIFTVSDISLRKKAEQQQMQAEKFKGVIEMAGAVCHELNQPLQSILGHSELLIMDVDHNDPSYKQFKVIVEQVERMRDLTQKLQKITKYKTKNYLDETIIDIEKAAQASFPGIDADIQL